MLWLTSLIFVHIIIADNPFGVIDISADQFGRTPGVDYWQHVQDVQTHYGRIKIKNSSVLKYKNQITHDKWNTTTIKGANYIPSYSHNSIATWIDFDKVRIDKEIGYGKVAHINAVRVTLHWIAWQYNPAVFLSNLENLVDSAHRYGMRVVLVLFDNKGGDNALPSWIPSKRYINNSWVANPGQKMVANSSTWPQLEEYVKQIVSKYKTDPRVAGWDIINTPQLGSSQQAKEMLVFAQHFSNIVNSVDTDIHFKTFSILPGGAACGSGYFPLMDVVSFQNFNGNPGAIAGDTRGVLQCSQAAHPPKPVILTEFVHRTGSPNEPLCEAIFEAWGGQKTQWSVDHDPIGYFVNQLILGVNEYCQNDDQGLVYPDGRWYSKDELKCLSAVHPPLPPPPAGPPSPNITFEFGGLRVGLRTGSHAVQNLSLVKDMVWGRNFSFVPPLWQWLYPHKQNRSHPGAHSLGDITLRVQPATETNGSSWATYSSVRGGRDVPCHILPSPHVSVVDTCDLTKPLNAPGQLDTRYPLGLSVIRTWEKSTEGPAGVIMRFKIKNTNNSAVRIGGFGMSLPADTTWGGHTTEQVAGTLSFIDASISGQRSFATWTRADGSSTILVTPANNNSGMEAWRPVLEDSPGIQGGTYEWTVLSAAWSSEWDSNRQLPHLKMDYLDEHGLEAWPLAARVGKSPWPKWHLSEVYSNPKPLHWNPPTSKILKPGETVEYALKLTLCEKGPASREDMLVKEGQPVLHAVPGYVVATNMESAALYVLPPKGATVKNVVADPSNALIFGTPSIQGQFTKLDVKAIKPFIRVRVVIRYSDDTEQSCAYHTLPPFLKHVASYGQWAAQKAWLPADYPDPFNRGASVMAWDREENRHVFQDGRTFIVGLSDDAGGGNHLGFASKVNYATKQDEVTRIDDYIKLTLYGKKNATFLADPSFSLQEIENDRILMTVFYFHYNKGYKTPVQWNYPNHSNYYTEMNKCFTGPSWCSFNAVDPDTPKTWHPADYRAYNFPHQINSYFAMYRASRNYDKLKTYQSWQWYLERAFKTLLALGCYDNHTQQFGCIPMVGLMDGTVFREVLYALEEEGLEDKSWKAAADTIRQMMYNRTISGFRGTSGWNNHPAPFGSEFNWDTTGQEEVAVWGAYFNATSAKYGNLNKRVVDAILAYTPNVPNFAWHGSAAGWGDFSNNAKWMVMGGWEREGQHYRAGLNSIPLIERYRKNPNDWYLLETAMGAMVGTLCNIDVNGAPSMGFHTHPFMMDYDPYSGDYGLAFFGQSLNAGSYVVHHPDLGWLCYTCDIKVSESTSRTLVGNIVIEPRDPYHRRAYIEPLGLWLVVLAGTIQSITVDFDTNHFSILFAAATDDLYSNIVLQLSNPAISVRSTHNFKIISPSGSFQKRGSFFVPPNKQGTTTVIVTWQD